MCFFVFSPKSPPNSPNNELCTEDELKGVYINYWNKVRVFQTLLLFLLNILIKRIFSVKVK